MHPTRDPARVASRTRIGLVGGVGIVVALAGIAWWLGLRAETADLRTQLNQRRIAAALEQASREHLRRGRAAHVSNHDTLPPEESGNPGRSSEAALRELLERILARQRESPRPTPPRAPRSLHGDYFPELMEIPEYAALANEAMAHEELLKLAPYLDWLGVAPEHRARVARLMIESRLSEIDAEQLADGVVLDPVAESDLRGRARAEPEAQLRALLGENTYRRLLEFRQAGPDVGSLINRLHDRLSYATEPLSPAQAQALHALGIRHKLGNMISDDEAARVAADAGGMLSRDQLRAFQEVLSEHNAGKRQVRRSGP